MAEEELADNGITGEAEDVAALREALEKRGKEAERYLANWQRAQADLANYKKYAEQEKQEILSFGNSLLILSLLPLVDDFERAFASLPAELDGLNWIEGIKIIYNNLKAALEKAGVSVIKAEGEPFDPRFHEAVMHQPGKEGIILAEIQKGYKLKDRVLRPSRVVVGGETEEGSHGQGSRD